MQLPNSFLRKFLTAFILVSLLFSFSLTPVKADIDDYRQNCSTSSVNGDCMPPQLSDIQVLVAKLMTSVWSIGAVGFFLILLYNGSIYLLGSWEESEYILGASIKDIQKRMAQWGTGFFMFFLSYPLMNTILGGLVADSNCYTELREPGFTFFFPSVCNEIEININPEKTDIDEDDLPSFSMDCDQFDRFHYDEIGSIDSFCNTQCGSNFTTITEYKVKNLDYYVYCDCGNEPYGTCLGVMSTP